MRHLAGAPLALLIATLDGSCTSSAPRERSLLLTNVVLYDGTGQAPRRGALRVVGDTIAAVADPTPGTTPSGARRWAAISAARPPRSSWTAWRRCSGESSAPER